MSSSIGMVRMPFGPFTDSTDPSTEALTPLGRATGTFPIRLILKHLRQHLAADILLARFRVGQNALGRRDDGDAEAVAHPRQLLRTRIDPAAGLRDTREMLDGRTALEIFQLDAQALGRPERLFHVAADLALALEDVEHARAQLRRGAHDGVLARLLAVADAGEHITQRIGQWHSSTFPARLREAGDQALIAHLPQHDPRKPEFAVNGARTPRQLAAVADAGRIPVARNFGHLQPGDQAL